MRSLILVCVIGVIASPASADLIHVPNDYPTIQDAVNAASIGDTVMVADGTYVGVYNRDIDPLGKSIVIQSANGPEYCFIDCGRQGRGFFIHSGETRDCVIKGFTILNGYEADFNVSELGQGIYINGASPEISDCIIRSCGFIEMPGGPAGPSGGGIAIANSAPLIRDCIIEDNKARYGGGFYISYASPEIVRCTVRKNIAAAYISWFPYGEYWDGDGGGLFSVMATDLVLLDCVFKDNNSTMELSDVNGDNASFLGSDGAMTNCTFTGHKDDAEIFFGGNGPFVIQNSIVHYIGGPGTAIHDMVGALEVRYSNIKGGWPGVGNIDADPDFMDPPHNDYSLKPTSPCIDAGDPTYLPHDHVEDYNRCSRLLDGNLDRNLEIDMGAHEYSNIGLSLSGDPLPGADVRLSIEGKRGLACMVFGGFLKRDPAPLIHPYGYLLIDITCGLPPIIPLTTIPQVYSAVIPSNAAVGTWVYLLPVCKDPQNNAANLGGYLKITVL